MSMENHDEQMEQVDKLQTALTNEQMELFRTEFLDLHPYDQARFFIDQEQERRFQIYYYLSPEEMAQIMVNIDLEDTTSLIMEIDIQFSSQVFNLLKEYVLV